jgi:peptidoglycan hydrolase CwlO-like protein
MVAYTIQRFLLGRQMDIQITDLITVIGAFGGLFGAWWKINQDTEHKIEAVRVDSDKKLSILRQEHTDSMAKFTSEVASIRTTAISRQEHDRDIDKVKEEIRAFREEVRDDIKTLSTNLTQRFDLMMQKMFELKNAKDS